jgi:hypothetical protein
LFAPRHPVFLARVSLDLPLESALPRQCSMAMPLLEAVEQRATEAGIPVDSRIVRGRNRRHALRQAISEERFDRIVNGVTLDLDTPAGATGLLRYIDQTRATLTADLGSKSSKANRWSVGTSAVGADGGVAGSVNSNHAPLP